MKQFFIVLLTVFVTATYAQAQFTFGARMGLNCTTIQFGGNEETKMKPGLLIGAVADYSINEILSIESGLFFAMRGYKVRPTVCWSGPDGGGCDKVIDIENLNYIQIPVHVVCKIDNRLRFRVGPYFGFAVGGKNKSIWPRSGKNKSVFVHKLKFGNNDHSNYKIFDFGFNAGLAVQLHNIQIGLEVSNSLTSIKKRSVYLSDRAHNLAFTLTTTYMFGNNNTRNRMQKMPDYN